MAGAQHDPLAALLFCPGRVWLRHSIVNGRVVVREGQIGDPRPAAPGRAPHNALAAQLAQRGVLDALNAAAH